MNDNDHTIHDELASAYLDDDLDATQRAAVTADPATMARVEAFRAVRAALKDVEPVVDSTRTAAVAAALAAFGAAEPTVAASAIPITQLAARRRSRSLQILTGVAAAAAIGVLGVAIARNSNSEDSKFSSAVPAASDAVLAAPKVAAADNAAQEAPAATTAAAGATNAPAALGPTDTILVAIDTPAALAQFATAARSAGGTAVPPSTAAPAASAAPAVAGEIGTGYNATTCPSADAELLGTVSYQGTIAVVIRSLTTGAIQALAADDCRVLETVQP